MGRLTYQPATWLCLLAFVFAGPLEGDEAEVSADANSPKSIVQPPADRAFAKACQSESQKGRTIDFSFLVRVRKLTVPLARAAMNCRWPAQADRLHTQRCADEASGWALPLPESGRTIVLLL